MRRKYEFITTHRQQFPTEVMCRELGVAPSGYYQWLKCPQSARAVEDARLLRLIRASFTASQGIYGARGCSLISERPARRAESIALPA